MTANIELHEASNDLAAVYVDGILELAGDWQLVTDYILQLVHVRRVASAAFMLGQDDPEQAALTLDEIREWEIQRDEAGNNPATLRAKAQELINQAEIAERKMRPQWG